MRKYVPNIITSIRLALCIAFPIVFILNTKFAFFLFVLFINGGVLDKTSTKRNLTISKYDKKIDKIVSGIIVLSALIISIFKIDKALLINLLLEIILIVIKIFLVEKKNNHLLLLNKVRFFLLNVLIIIGLSVEFNLHLDLLFYLLMVITTLLQSAIIIKYLKIIKQKKIP